MLKISKNRKCLVASILFFLSIFMFSAKKYSISFDGFVRGVKPVVVWEFIMDFNNMKKLNPTIIDFTILSDRIGNDNEWQYQVKYTEILHQLPFIKNEAIAVYQFITTSDNEFEILSKHRTCFFLNSYCVNTSAKFWFQLSKGIDTYMIEEVLYECPRIMSHFCYTEVLFQRESIFKNLDILLSLK